jgi:hypothetical protein
MLFQNQQKRRIISFSYFSKFQNILIADDTVLMAESSSNLQTLLDKFYLYCDTWKMKVNVDKTNIVVFSKGRLPRNLILQYYGFY